MWSLQRAQILLQELLKGARVALNVRRLTWWRPCLPGGWWCCQWCAAYPRSGRGILWAEDRAVWKKKPAAASNTICVRAASLKRTGARLGYRSRSSEAVHGGGGDEIKSRSVLKLLPPLRSAPLLHCCAHGEMAPSWNSLSPTLSSSPPTISPLCRSPHRLSSRLDETLSNGCQDNSTTWGRWQRDATKTNSNISNGLTQSSSLKKKKLNTTAYYIKNWFAIK